ncbi:MAG: stage III sporulation protein AA [Thermoanaerobacterales bacterium]|nr:stage III sporulation protein AA [Bacillota bacterium]MDI6906757.1 stage III sporulation protein AA [Thermoanaerobacterales bacterium]
MRRELPTGTLETLRDDVSSFFPPRLRSILLGLSLDVWGRVEEIRLRLGRPLALNLGEGEVFVDARGRAVDARAACAVSADDLQRTVQLVTGASLYAVEDELRQGFVTVAGGHRVGFAGRVILDGRKVRTIKHLAALNFRISREVRGAADAVMPLLIDGSTVRHTLIISPPRSGKTTLLRDAVRQLSDGIPALGFPGVTVGLVDERSEVAGCFRGVPQRDVGMRTDVLDACPKAEGMMMLLRALSPQVIATDEIGRREDVGALEEVLNAGVSILATAHAASVDELRRRPVFRDLLALGIIERFIVLGRARGPGTVEAVIEGRALRREAAAAC